MSVRPSPTRLENGGGDAERPRLRRATLSDAAALQQLFAKAGAAGQTGAPDMRQWLEQGGALLLEDRSGRALCAVRWRDVAGGWSLDPVATLPEARGQGFGRWLMTKVEALAIRHNVPRLTLEPVDDERLPYYRRLGYMESWSADGAVRLSKRVGGVWQLQAPHSP